MIQIDGCDYVPIEYYSDGWTLGPPRGIIFHLSDTSSFDDFYSSIKKSGSSAHFYVPNDSNNPTVQMVSVDNRSWHSLEASHYYFGIVHECISGQIYLTPDQLRESARISAELIKASKELWGISIPIIRAPGPGFSPGFKDHKDGLGSDWNKFMHTDGLIMTWNWNQYLDETRFNIEEDDMALFEDKNEFRNEVRKALAGTDKDGNPTLAAEEIASSLQFILGLNLRLGSSMRPTESGPKQRGWDMADVLLKSDDENSGFPRKGKLVGTVSFDE